MKKKSLVLGFMLILLFALSTSLMSQTTITIGSGSSTYYYYPISTFHNYNYTQQIYYSSEINTGSCTITHIAFNYGGSSLYNSNDWVIYLGNTTKSSFSSNGDWVPASSMTQVYSGTLPQSPGSGWLTITLASPFSYTGNNLVIAVDENTAGSTLSYSWYRFDGYTSNRTLYENSYTNIDPADVSEVYGTRTAYGPQLKITYTTPMSFSSSTTETASTSVVSSSSSNNEIIRLNVVTTGSSNPINTTSITFNTTGTTSTSDITNAKVYYTTSTTFATTTQFGSTTANPDGSFTVTGSQTLVEGNNYFWLAYDIVAGANSGNRLDGQCTAATVGGIERTPTETNPTGHRSVDYNIWYSNSSTGNDNTGDGSSGSPYQSFHKAYTEAAAGDKINLTGTFDWTNGTGEDGDTYTNDNGYVIDKNISITGQGADQTIIQADDTENTAGMRIFTISSAVTVTIENVTMRYGYVSYAGGGGAISLETGTLTLNYCRIHNNRSYDSGGGGIDHYSGTLIINGCTIDHNGSGGEGGGIYHIYGSLTITNSTISHNRMYGFTGSGGGGIQLDFNGTGATITNCTICYNTLDANNDGAGLNVNYVTVYLKNTIIANNLTNTDATPTPNDFENTGYSDYTYNCIIEAPAGYYYFSNGNNGNHIGTGTGSSLTINISSTLAQNNSVNGTPTLSISSGSIAINAGSETANNGVSIPTTDQRGAARVSTVDIGAYEFGSDPPTVVTLSSFTAIYANGSSLLEWTTQSESNNRGWNIYRSETELENAVQINGSLINGAGTSTEPTEYEFYDEEELVIDATYNYWLESISFSGQTEHFGPISLTIPEEGENPELPDIISNIVNYPNPFSSNTEISFMLNDPANVKVTVYNIKGQEVIKLYDGNCSDERFSTLWNGKDNNDNEVTSGMYFYKLEIDDEIYTGKMILMD